MIHKTAGIIIAGLINLRSAGGTDWGGIPSRRACSSLPGHPNAEEVADPMLISGPNWADVVQAVGAGISAIASIALVIVAINFRDEVRLARKRPELTLWHNPVVDTMVFREPHWNYDLYMRVENKPGQDRATSVGLELVDVRPCGDTAPLVHRPPRRSFVVAELHGYETTEVDLPPNISRRFLVAYHDVRKSEGGVELALKPRAQSRRDILPPGTYDLTVALTASNADATYWKTRLTFLGVSGPEEELPTRLTITSPVRTSAVQ